MSAAALVDLTRLPEEKEQQGGAAGSLERTKRPREEVDDTTYDAFEHLVVACTTDVPCSDDDDDDDDVAYTDVGDVLDDMNNWPFIPTEELLSEKEQIMKQAPSDPAAAAMTAAMRDPECFDHLLLVEDDLLGHYADASEWGNPSTLDLIGSGTSTKQEKDANEDARHDDDTMTDTKYQQALQQLRERHAAAAPVAHAKEKHLDFLWNEFGELCKTAASTATSSSSGTTCCAAAASIVNALQDEHARLVQQYANRHDCKTPLQAARQIVAARQKRRKLRRKNSAAALQEQQEQEPCWNRIQPWHIVLGDHSTRSRTIATNALRYFCVQAKHRGTALDAAMVLKQTQTWLQQAFPTAPDAGMILYMVSKASERFVEPNQNAVPYSSFNTSMTSEDDCNYNNGNKTGNTTTTTTFLPVLAQHELEVVKRVYTKLTPSHERSLTEIVQAYRTILCQPQYRHAPGAAALEKLLNFCQQAEKLALTPTALNGLRESLDQQWEALVDDSKSQQQESS